jgi:RNA polymerase sigma-70 factor (ECF subfamily)
MGSWCAGIKIGSSTRYIGWLITPMMPKHKAVLILKDIEGQKYEVIAEILQVPIGTIRSRLHRARMELRELMQKEEQ